MDAILNNAPVEIYLKDREGRYIRINRQFETIFGVKNEDLVGKFPADAHDPELAATTRAQDLEVLQTGQIGRREEQARLVSDGKMHTLLTIKFPIFNTEGGIDGLGAVVTDITERKQAEGRFLDIVNTIEGIVWEADASTLDMTYVSKAVEKILGYTQVECLEPGFWVSKILPEDGKELAATAKNNRDGGYESYESTYRVLDKQNRIVWVRDIISVEKENGKARWLRGITFDITYQMQIELEKGEIEERFRQMFMSASIGFALADFQTSNAIEYNKAYCDIVGRTESEILNLGWRSLVHPDDLKKEELLLKKFRAGEIDRYSIDKRYFKSDGSTIWAHAEICNIDLLETSKTRQYLVMIQDITERKSHEKKIWHQAHYDFLTGLPNRSLLQDRVVQLIKKGTRSGKAFAFLLIDLDGFKDINDTLGHDKGDELLIEVAGRIEQTLRDSDTVARLGGDEFVVLISDFDNRYSIDKLAENITSAISNPYQLDLKTVHITASLGITMFPEDGEGMVSLLKNADQAMYAAKKLGRNQYQYFTQSMQQTAIARMQLIGDMRLAIQNERFSLLYQPIVTLSSGEIHKAEALLRWDHEKLGLIEPEGFISVAEDSGLINDIGVMVFNQVTKQAKDWAKNFDSAMQISVNVSAVQFQQRLNLFDFQQQCERFGHPICIEITESLLMASNPEVIELLQGLRKTGLQISLDDFGTGYSSLSYLRKFDIDYLKIDRIFVSNLVNSPDDRALCTAIVAMAHTLGMKVIAEGIETEKQLGILKKIGCDYGQGFYISDPLSADDFTENHFAANAI